MLSDSSIDAGDGPDDDAPEDTSARPTIYDVARDAGVSVMTVSRVLNDKPSVRPSVKQAVVHSIEKLQFEYSQSARDLASLRRKVAKQHETPQ